MIAPAGPTPTEHAALVEPLFARFGLRSRLYPSCHARHAQHDFLSGDDATRLADLHAAFADDDVAAVFALRGGWGSARCSTASTRRCCAPTPKPLIGFSDITGTARAAGARRPGRLACADAGSNLVRDGNEDDAQALFDLLMRPLGAGHRFGPAPAAAAWRVPGRVSGRLVGGNLSIVASLLGTPWAWPTEGTILFLEDVSEALYRVDRLMTQLRHAGVLAGAPRLPARQLHRGRRSDRMC